MAIAFKLDLLLFELPLEIPPRYRTLVREIRFMVSNSLAQVRRELFNLRDVSPDFQKQLAGAAGALELELVGEPSRLSPDRQRIISELVRNAASHSKGRNLKVKVTEKQILVSDDGQGLFGISQLAQELGGTFKVDCDKFGTHVEVNFP